MDIDWSAEVVDQVESHWRHRLRPRLDGLTDDEYFWQPVPDCWTISRRGQSSAPISFGTGEFTMDYGEPPHEREPVTTIAWRLVHLIVGFASTNGKLFGRAAASESTFCYAGTAGGALRQLDDEYEHWVDGVRSLGIAGLAQPQGDPPAFAHAPLAKKMLYANVEVIHHGAEICLLRDPLIIGLIYSTLLVAVRNSGDLSSFLRGGPPSSPVPAWRHQRITRRPAMRTADA